MFNSVFKDQINIRDFAEQENMQVHLNKRFNPLLSQPTRKIFFQKCKQKPKGFHSHGKLLPCHKLLMEQLPPGKMKDRNLTATVTSYITDQRQ